MSAEPIIELELPRLPVSARRARGALDAIGGRVPPPLLDDLRLMVSELVTNSVRHASGVPDGPIQLRVWMSEDTIRVEAADGGRGFDPQGPPARGGTGWGLVLVGRLATRWGVAAGEAGTTVWFERSLEGSPAR
jgi:anti-sigma regulatory factor (Ser/Thr protein kinase)